MVLDNAIIKNAHHEREKAHQDALNASNVREQVKKSVARPLNRYQIWRDSNRNAY